MSGWPSLATRGQATTVSGAGFSADIPRTRGRPRRDAPTRFHATPRQTGIECRGGRPWPPAVKRRTSGTGFSACIPRPRGRPRRDAPTRFHATSRQTGIECRGGRPWPPAVKRRTSGTGFGACIPRPRRRPRRDAPTRYPELPSPIAHSTAPFSGVSIGDSNGSEISSCIKGCRATPPDAVV